MFTAADDVAVGIPVVNEPYPDGEEGIQKSLKTICKKIREGAPTAVMKSFAGNLMKQAGFPSGTRAQGQAVLDYIRKNAMYAPDALGTEQIQTAAITLCVPGAPVCIPIYDCDDGVCAVATVMAALGHEVRVVRQIFGAGHQQHVLVEVRDEHGMWCALDPSSKTMPAGTKAAAEQETYHSPFDEDVPAKFVGIGKLGEGVRMACPFCVAQARAAGMGSVWCMHKQETAMQDENGVWVPVGQNVEALARGMVRPKQRRKGVGQIPGDLASEVKDLVIQRTDAAKAQIIAETRNSVWTAGLIGGAVGAAVGVAVGVYLARRR